MGSQVTKAKSPLGSKTLHTRSGIKNDHRNKRNSKKVKDELYGLFLEEKIIHKSIADELEKEIEDLEKKLEKAEDENRKLVEILSNYKNKSKNKRKQEGESDKIINRDDYDYEEE